MPHSLFRYIAAIEHHQQSGNTDTTISCCTTADFSYSDDDVDVIRKETEYDFADGVQIKYVVEYDDVAINDNVCPECWINYQVMVDPFDTIKPSKKSFYNRCQQQFWLKTMMMADSDNHHD
ncbi:hypothetical protein [Photobacterium kishitanii]|uniref:Uncharacterized protein n=1 Tax=Photobacterium kishitanii TaxID=318456 RepID=A0AAX0Z194_9GAMM|nr:hypothetical protein [Photobacterium kishitanii]PSV17372.1 hypothetical protein C0W59_04615 [Photobacterium kishitanii]PSW47705.1 hypothetical protein C0W66_17345 [Photobacterium kishitanii]PSX20381.1 hypothetical protein C0W70_05790 [Photobacterium kishitanii]PSX29143.1 hypothetical protein C0W52_03820 [Photobacterium kishitanii]PSX31895.1 hypothetical protein C0W39_13745 [Photobacterium kishitanii]